MPTISIDEQALFYQSPNPTSQVPAIVFVHGAGGSSHKWFNQLAYLAKSYRPIAIDLPGHAQSPGQGCSNIGDYRERIKSFAEALNLGPFILAGHSMGGAITLDFACQYPQRLLGMALISTGAKLGVSPDFLEILRQGKNTTNLREMAYSAKTSDEIFREGEKDYKLTSNLVRFNDFLACNAFDIRSSLPELSIPTLIICGDEDILTPVKYANYLQANLPQATTEIITQAGHMAMIEQPAAVNSALENFLKTLINH